MQAIIPNKSTPKNIVLNAIAILYLSLIVNNKH